MNATKITSGILLFVILLFTLTSLFTITEGQHAIILRLGRLVMDSKTDKAKIVGPGIHLKMPFVENVRTFDTRIQTLDIKSSRRLPYSTLASKSLNIFSKTFLVILSLFSR